MVMSSIIGDTDVPDLAHPLKFRQAEAKWKRAVSVAHAAFCSCGNFLLHFKWCSGERGDGGDQEGADGGATGGEDITENITGRTGGDEEVSDLELLQ
uniref:ORF2 n=1 Tax=Torque teno Leptonychotes weddellii virus-1 TaxID=2012676 RepID=A0A1Z2RWG3_9VIRU|nr:ORF2 [Torque teno Leptonychotes weddellii virus 1]ASA48954.1 ORF2 [Torque teno Leptonychotes weddellii virus 1]WCS65584.1 ORF2 [Torque teno Leptonychotes weddellii virus 1]